MESQLPKKVITMCYRKIIDRNSTKTWDRLVLEDSYRELQLQAQFYNQDKKYRTFAELIHQVKGADKLHFLVSGGIMEYVKQLREIIPDIANNIGRQFLTFNQFKFEIINSDLRQIDKHAVSISFYSEPLVWHELIGPYLLTSPVKSAGSETLTDLFAIQPYLSIHSVSYEACS